MINTEPLFSVVKDDQYGFINSKGKIIIDLEFDWATDFAEGLAQVEHKGKRGFIDRAGNWVFEVPFENVSWFSEGYAVVSIDEAKYGYIDKTGAVAIPAEFCMADAFDNGLAVVQAGADCEGSMIDRSGKVVLSGYNFSGSKYKEGMINCAGKKGWGFIDLAGNFIIPPVYKYAYAFYEGKAAVAPNRDVAGNSAALEFGFIDRSGEMIIPPVFGGADIRFSEGRCAVGQDGDWGYIDEKGEIVIPYQYHLGEHFSEGLAAITVKGRGEKCGFIDKQGNTVIPPVFYAANNFKDGLSEVIVEDHPGVYRSGYINKKGEYIWEPTR